jgi:type II secretory pathway component GspD/PulD (secretin)
MEKIALHYTTAKEVADIIKDVFRDLLSPNDKALSKTPGQQDQQQQQPRSLYSTTYILGGDADKDNARKFKGLLSIGVDDRSNTLVVSAPRDLMHLIMQIATELDEAARQTRGVVQIMKLGTSMSSEEIHKKISSMGKSSSSTTSTPPMAEQAQPGRPAGAAPPAPTPQ